MPDGEREIDPASFRTVAFRSFWEGRIRGVRTSDLGRRRVSRRDRSSTFGLSDILTVEARRWLELGSEIGYFALEFQPLPNRMLPVAESFFAIAPSAESPLEFAAEVAIAQDTLSPPHFRMLDLLYFADEDEWEFQLEQLRSFAEALDRQPALRPAPEWLDSFEWAFGEEHREEHLNPAFWRLGGLGRFGFGPLPDRVGQRVVALGRLRALIAGTVAWSVELEATAESSPLRPGLFWPSTIVRESPEEGSGR